MNFFEWIREAVRRAVLLGVSDAVEDLGTPPHVAESRGNMLAVLRGDEGAPQRRITGGTKGKKLGRSLNETAAQVGPPT